MRLFNQIGRPLHWDMGGGNVFDCEPWGSLEIEESLVPFVLKLGVPLGPLPVPPEVKAAERVAAAETATRDHVLEDLRAQVVRLTAESNAHKKFGEDRVVDLDKEREAHRRTQDELKTVRSELAAVKISASAADQLLAEHAGVQSEEVRSLTARAADALAAKGAAEDEVKRAQAQQQALNERLVAAKAELEAAKAAHKQAVADRDAANELLDETAKSAREHLQRAETAEKALKELREKRKGAAGEQRA